MASLYPWRESAEGRATKFLLRKPDWRGGVIGPFERAASLWAPISRVASGQALPVQAGAWRPWGFRSMRAGLAPTKDEEKARPPDMSATSRFLLWRRRRDSNSRDGRAAQRFSRPPHSTALPLLRAKAILPETRFVRAAAAEGPVRCPRPMCARRTRAQASQPEQARKAPLQAADASRAGACRRERLREICEANMSSTEGMPRPGAGNPSACD